MRYNGPEGEEDQILKLSDAFIPEGNPAESDIEARVRIVNINYGKNEGLMACCRPLGEYAWLVGQIRKNQKSMGIEQAVDKAIQEVPEDFEIREFLIGHRAEVKDLCITEYNEAETMQMIREEGRLEGREEGREEGNITTLYDLYRDGDITLQRAAVKAGMSEADFLKAAKKLQEHNSF